MLVQKGGISGRAPGGGFTPDNWGGMAGLSLRVFRPTEHYNDTVDAPGSFHHFLANVPQTTQPIRLIDTPRYTDRD